jgi:hypothetical protein
MDSGKRRGQAWKLSLHIGFWYIPALAIRFAFIRVCKGDKTDVFSCICLLTGGA